MKITALKQQIKNPQRVSVFTDEKYSFSLSLDELVTHKIKKDDELSEADVKRFKKISSDGKLKARALEWLLNRPHSTREFKDYMYRKKAEPELTDKLITEFSERKYLSDESFAKWFIELQQRKNRSNRAIRSELFKKGIGRELADEILAADTNHEDERLKELVAKKQSLSRYKNDPVKLKRYLVGQGFSYSQVDEALKNT